MIASYASAHKRINEVLELFVGGCAVVLAAAAVQGHPRLPIVCLLSGLIGHAIPAHRASPLGRTPSHDPHHGERIRPNLDPDDSPSLNCTGRCRAATPVISVPPLRVEQCLNLKDRLQMLSIVQ